MSSLKEKEAALDAILNELASAAVAFSGGVDSAYLLARAHAVLGARAAAVTIHAASVPEREKNEARHFCEARGIRHFELELDQFAIEGFSSNPKDRCYICKKALFTKLRDFAAAHGISEVIEGSNLDDGGDYRPGMRALEELGIRSPLKEAGLAKSEIRELSKAMQLPTWDKPSLACLATRFVYGETITPERLRMVEQAEQLLWDLGFRQLRVRIHEGTLARIEVLPGELPALFEKRQEISERFRAYGFTYVTMDLGGYRTGSMNETLAAAAQTV